ncbi:hypothetical protein ACFYP4_02420 [Streptomyces sp. NPDC005551]|uniref:hypothetical protein n=1 Tax=Streptomyces sp. NPDC005551 TaxID=3364725 RepID=UPI0036AD62F9
MNNVSPLHSTQRVPQTPSGVLLPTMQATDAATGECFAWNGSHPYVIQVFDSWRELMAGRQSDLVLPFGAINPVSQLPAWHNYVDTIRRFQNR